MEQSALCVILRIGRCIGPAQLNLPLKILTPIYVRIWYMHLEALEKTIQFSLLTNTKILKKVPAHI